MAVIGLDHIQLAIPAGGEDAAREFYGNALGMREVAKPAGLSKSGCWFESGTLKLHLGVDPDFTPAKKAHPALLVVDIAALEAILAERGHPIRTEVPISGYTRLFTQDPFANRIEIMQKNVPDG